MLGKCRSALCALTLFMLPAAPADAADLLRLAISQKGQWDTSMVEFGVREGFFRQEGLDLDLFYTNGTAETQQAVISGSVDVGIAVGFLGLLAAYTKGAPVRVIAGEWTGASDFFWYARADSPVGSLAEAEGRTVGFSTVGSSSNLVLLALLDQHKVKARPTPTGGTAATMTQVLSGQIDVGWSQAPIGLEEVRAGKLKIVAKGTEATALADQTTRVSIATAETLATKRPILERFMTAYAKTIDWAYGNDTAVRYLAEGLNIPRELARAARDENYPKDAMRLDVVRGLDLTMRQAVELKRLTAPLTAAQTNELIQLVPARHAP
ncbi:ABC transporter substrate-binding protein [Azospirillum doebereinerae]